VSAYVAIAFAQSPYKHGSDTAPCTQSRLPAGKASESTEFVRELVVDDICVSINLCDIGGEDVLLRVDEKGCLLLNGLDNLWVAVPS
jgi:hypothetical protein